MFVPRIPGEVTIDWLNQILNNYVTSSSPNAKLALDSFESTTACGAGESFNSELASFKVFGKLKENEESEETVVSYELILKFLSADPFSRGAGMAQNCQTKEYKIYSQIRLELLNLYNIKLENPATFRIPELIHGYNEGQDFVLVMQDERQKGFKVNNKRKGLSYEQLKLIFKALAQQHALSYWFDNKYDFVKKYPEFYFDHSRISFIGFFKPVLINISNFLKLTQNYTELGAKLEQNITSIIENIISFIALSKKEFFCLTHGDLWNSNILFKYNDDSQPIEVSFLDWQMSYFSNPMSDIQYLLKTSTFADVRQKHLNELLQIYHKEFSKICEQYGVTCWTIQELKDEYNKANYFGFLMGLILSQGTLSETMKQKYEEKNKNVIKNPRGKMFHLKSRLTAKCVKLLFRPTFQCLLEQFGKTLFDPIIDELMEGKNEVMNKRIIDLVMEAETLGLIK